MAPRHDYRAPAIWKNRDPLRSRKNCANDNALRLDVGSKHAEWIRVPRLDKRLKSSCALH
jgi:hypothetical protein